MAILRPKKKKAEEAKVETPEVEVPSLSTALPQRIYDAYILNLDGTAFHGEMLMPGVDRILKTAEHMRRPVMFKTTDPHLTSEEYARILSSVGVEVEPSQIISPASIAIRYLDRMHPGAAVYAIASDSMRAELEAGGVKLTDDPKEIDVVLVSHDRNFNFEKLNIAYEAISVEKRALLVTTSMSRRRYLPDGTTEPGTAAIVAAIEAATKTKASKNLGSPATDVLEAILEKIQVAPEDAILVSDSLAADIRMARAFGMPAALVLTGESTREQAAAAKKKEQPNFVIDHVEEILPAYIVDQI